MAEVRISQWGSNHKHFGVSRSVLTDAWSGDKAVAYVTIPRSWHPREALARVDALTLTSQERSDLIAQLAGQQTCSQCKRAAPIAVAGYSHGLTGQVPDEPFCGACLEWLCEWDGLRSLGITPYPGVEDPRFDDGRRIADVYPQNTHL